MITPNSGLKLTKVYGGLEDAINAPVPGMAHFATTGPEGTTCRSCQWWGSKKKRRDGQGYLCAARCRKARMLGVRVKAGVPPTTPSCRHFQQIAEAPPLHSDRTKKASRNVAA